MQAYEAALSSESTYMVLSPDSEFSGAVTCATVRTATRIEDPVLDSRCKAGLPWVGDGPRRPASEMYVRTGSRLFSNSGIGCQALRDVPAGFTVLSVAICALARDISPAYWLSDPSGPYKYGEHGETAATASAGARR